MRVAIDGVDYMPVSDDTSWEVSSTGEPVHTASYRRGLADGKAAHKRNGAVMSCGCWTADVTAGDTAGRTHRDCPLHGHVLMEKANVEEPWSAPPRWIQP